LISACHTAPPAKPTLRDIQISELRSLGFVENGDDWLLTIAEPISFDLNQAELKPQLRKDLVVLASRLLSVDVHDLRIEGHTDNVGPRDYNEKLSLARAKAVASVFIDNGFEKDKIVCRGLAWDFPLLPNTTLAGRAENRRVNVIVAGSSFAPLDANAD
jgi:outer membrane protein OmpA-like peptidoglycan-associated protein